jgi:hypothetical protein
LSGTFSGNGAGVTSVNAAALNGLNAANFWQTTGNSGTSAGVNFAGTVDNQPFEMHVNGLRAWRLEVGGLSAASGSPTNTGAPNVVGGSPVNVVASGVVGAVISGGGATNYIGDVFSNSIEAYSDFSTIGGGLGNIIGSNATASTIGGGWGNQIQFSPSANIGGYNSVIAGGLGNSINCPYATIGGGSYHSIGYDCNSGTINGGYKNSIESDTFDSTIGGGSYQTIGGFSDASTISGGTYNSASGDGSTVPGGEYNLASGNYSFAAGYGAQATNDGSFVWADDDSGNTFSSTANDQFAVRAAGGVLLEANVAVGTGTADYRQLSLGGGNSTGFLYGSYPALGDGIHLGYNGHVINSGGPSSMLTVGYGTVSLWVGASDGSAPSTERLSANGSGVTVYGTFNNSSDRNAKQDFAPVSASQILDKVLELPVSEWSYKTDSTIRHIGPVGQDFYSLFKIGTDEKHIAPIDEGGVALAAIQGLNRKMEAENAALKNEVAELKALVQKLAGSQAR